jgi:hypothetical protein
VWQVPRERLRAHLGRAVRWCEAMLNQPGLTQRELAVREGLPQPRISEGLALLRLPKAVLLDLVDPSRTGPVPTLEDLEALARLADGAAQVARYQRLCREAARPGNGRRAGVARGKGFQHLLARARRYQAMLESGEHRSAASIARVEGIDPSRVSQVLDLLTLAPEVLAVIDVPAEEVPAGVRQADLRKLVRLDHEAQRVWAEQHSQQVTSSDGCQQDSKRRSHQ